MILDKILDKIYINISVLLVLLLFIALIIYLILITTHKYLFLKFLKKNISKTFTINMLEELKNKTNFFKKQLNLIIKWHKLFKFKDLNQLILFYKGKISISL